MKQQLLLYQVDRWYVQICKNIYCKGKEMGGKNKWGEKPLVGPREPFCDTLTYIGGTFLPRIRDIAQTPISHFYRRRQKK